MLSNKAMKERTIENHLRHYRNYKIGIINCQKQMDYIMPNITARYDCLQGSSFWISNDTARVAIDRIESKRAIDLNEEIERFKLITESIDNAFKELSPQEKDFVEWRYFSCLPIYEVKKLLGYSEDKSVYRIRRHTLDKLAISLSNLWNLK